MGGEQLMTFTQSFAMLSYPQRLHRMKSPQLFITASLHTSSARLGISRAKPWNFKTNVVSDSGKPTTFTIDPAGDSVDVLPDSGGNSGDFPGGGSGDSGGGGNDGGENGGEWNEEKDGGKKGMSMSQKITLGYAALVGIGGLMGYLKGGSQKSLVAGGGSAGLLLVVFALLPSSPVLASGLGLGLSAALVGVMGPRFLKSGKVFPAGVVSLASVIMSVGYVHGIFRSSAH